MIKIVRGYKTELDLNNGQRNVCLRAAGTARFAYNWGLEKKKAALKSKTNAIADVGFGRFKQFLAYKTVWNGITLLKADRFYPSTQTCSKCGRKRTINLTLADRTFVCEFEDCRHQMDRDLNAAINLKKLALHPTASSAGSNACGE